MTDHAANSGNNEQQLVEGANITYLRHMAETLPGKYAEEVRLACDDIEDYREFLGLLIGREEPNRLRSALKSLTWGNGYTEEDYDRAIYGGKVV